MEEKIRDTQKSINLVVQASKEGYLKSSDVFDLSER